MTSSPAARGTAIVLVAHGSRSEPANDAHRSVADRLQQAADAPVVAAFLELAEPSIPAAIADVVDAGADLVLVLPHFLYPGRHLARDIPALVAESADRHPGVRVEMLEAFGADPGVLELLTEQIHRALDPHG